jgi:hypothetical protein
VTQQDQPKVDTVRLQRMVRAYRESGTLMAAVELGLFTQVARGADTEAALARALDIEPVNAERLVTACVGLELLKRNGDRLENAPDVARFLVEGERNYAGAWMLFTKPDWDEWGRLADHLRRMGPPSTLGMYDDFTVERARRYHEATYSIGMGAGICRRWPRWRASSFPSMVCPTASRHWPAISPRTRSRAMPMWRSWPATCRSMVAR